VTFIGTATRAIATGAAIASSILLSGCVSTVSGTATRAEPTGPSDVPLLDESQLDDILLSISEINAIMKASRMKITTDIDEMTDYGSDVSDPECLGAIYGAQEPVYAGSGWTDIRDQVAREEGDTNDHWVEQAVVLYPTAEDAQQFFDDAKGKWDSCANYSVTVDSGGSSYLWQLGDVTAEETMLSQKTEQEDADGWGCQHALSVVSNVTIEAWACSYSVGEEAIEMANDMVNNAKK
jgi:hypothetical protein